MTWIVILFAAYVVAGLLRPGRLGSTHVAVLVCTLLALGCAYLRLGS